MGWSTITSTAALAILACHRTAATALPNNVSASPTSTGSSIHLLPTSSSPASPPAFANANATNPLSPSLTTSYPTVVTSYWSTTVTILPSAEPTGPGSNATNSTVSSPAAAAAAGSWVIRKTVTVIEPWTASPDPASFPHTLLQTSIVSMSATHYDVSGKTSLSIPSPDMLPISTWVIWDTAPRDLPVGNVPGCESGCTPDAWKPDRRCVAAHMATRCRAQCIIREWQWWCLKEGEEDKTGFRDPTLGNSSNSSGASAKVLPMGRLCWDNSTNYVQLLEPCDGTDYAPDCLPCRATAAN